MGKKEVKAQIGIEYLLIVGFVTFAVIVILGVGLFYAGKTRDGILFTQVDNFANKVISAAESVFYAGEPAKTTITGYLPRGIQDIDISENTLFITFETSSGQNKIGYISNVPIQEGTNMLTNSAGTKEIELVAQMYTVVINQG